MRALRTAVIGLGRVGWRFHIPSILGHEGFELVAVVDPLPERRDEAITEFASRSRSGIEAYANHISLLDAVALDLIVIASPTPFHAEQAIAAFERGVDVFCDKPIAPSLQEADRMIAAMEAYHRKLMVYQPHRLRIETIALKASLEQDLIGPVKFLYQPPLKAFEMSHPDYFENSPG